MPKKSIIRQKNSKIHKRFQICYKFAVVSDGDFARKTFLRSKKPRIEYKLLIKGQRERAVKRALRKTVLL